MSFARYLFYLKNIGLRYFVFAGILFLLFYIVLWPYIGYKKIQPRRPLRTDYLREVGYSISTMCIFAGVVWAMLNVPPLHRLTRLYTDKHAHSQLWFWLAFPVMAVLHDTYFYWMHRAMHHRKLFRIFHLVHHKSTNPSPWAAYAFHPLEALVEAGIYVVFLLLLPLHPLHIGFFFLFMIVYNVYGHLGYEMYPAGFSKHWLGRWLNTSVNHNGHHQYFKGNFGLYFTFWDRAMGTLRPDYDQRFTEVTTKKKA